MKKLLNFLEGINELVGKVCSLSVIVLLLLVVIEVIRRKIFNCPTLWSLDVTTHIYAFHFMMVTGYTLLHKGHVSIDVVSKNISSKRRTILDLISYIVLFFHFCFMLLWYGTLFAAESWEEFETAWGIFQMPLYPLKTVIPVTALLIIIQGLNEFIRKLHFVVRGKNYV